jgi:Holliday junction resolvase RusA-like endonuclease
VNTLNFTIWGIIHGGKNNIGITRTGKRYPKPNWAKWRNEVLYDLQFYLNQIGFKEPIDKPCRITVRYWAGDNRRRDIPALSDAIFHIIERARIVKDDFQFKTMIWGFMGVDKKNARAEITVEEL